ncbi:unnamed protein product [Brassica napus]|uniref:(rape) hypothetical protein n=1 Tax=Brassica napus TaxID=3708 RepID=A0A816RHU6_BRANA|nr:unnamed protein product [Brassica napus]
MITFLIFCRMRQSHRMKHLPFHCLHRLGLKNFLLIMRLSHRMRPHPIQNQ